MSMFADPPPRTYEVYPAGDLARDYVPAEGPSLECQLFARYTIQPDGSVVVDIDLGFDEDFVLNEDTLTDDDVDAMEIIKAATAYPMAVTVRTKPSPHGGPSWQVRTGTPITNKETA